MLLALLLMGLRPLLPGRPLAGLPLSALPGLVGAGEDAPERGGVGARLLPALPPLTRLSASACCLWRTYSVGSNLPTPDRPAGAELGREEEGEAPALPALDLLGPS